ncbi:Fc.00g095180.m01.CDS01 [Cosmosporella sp. VM-42]
MDLEIESPNSGLNYSPLDAFPNCDRLQRSQQDYFLDLFWQGYHVIYPVLDEDAFRRHYESLWEGASFRRPSPLVDTILALCVQFGSTYMSPSPDVANNSSQPGREFYWRAHYHLHQEFESPSLVSVQCYFFSIIYLLAAGKMHSAYTMTGTAVRMAHSLGLHQGAVEEKSTEEESRVQWTENMLWNCLSILDIQSSLHFGRPFSIYHPEPSISSSPESVDMTTLMGPAFILSPKLGVNWLTFQTERLRLFQLIRSIQEKFSAVCNDVLEDINALDFYHDPLSREKCAGFLLQELKKLKEWTQELPDGLKAARHQGVPLSVDRSSLDLSQDDPLWLQRQRLVLELEYHTLCITLCRQFVTFLPTPALGTLSSDNNCISCVNHAITATRIMHQVLRDTDILTGWYQVVDWQRNAMFALAGFACGYPICPPTPSSRKALAASATVLKISGSSTMATLAQRLDTKAVEIIKDFTARLGISTPIITPPPFGEEDCNIADAMSKTHMNTDSSIMGFSLEALGDSIDISGVGLDTLWAGDGSSTSLLWGDFMKDMERGLTSSTGEDMIISTADQT